MNSVSIHSLHVGVPRTLKHDGENYISAIHKESIHEAYLTKDGFREDQVADKKHHGGSDRAILVYPYEHYELWNNEFQTTLKIPAFGENLTISGMTESHVHIGDVYQIGAAVVQVSQGRIPCNTLSKYNGINEILPRLVETGYTGYLCRVIEEGVISKVSNINLLEREPDSESVLFGNKTYFHDRSNKEALEKILANKFLADEWKQKVNKLLLKL